MLQSSSKGPQQLQLSLIIRLWISFKNTKSLKYLCKKNHKERIHSKFIWPMSKIQPILDECDEIVQRPDKKIH